MSITTDDFRVTSSNPSGATIATDYVNNTHFQEVKINTGVAGADSIMSHTSPIPVEIGKNFIPIAGNSAGTIAAPVEICGGASLTVSGVTLNGGTVNRIVGGSLDVSKVAAGVTIGVGSSGLDGITASITGDVKLAASSNNIGDVDVLTVAIPTGFTSAGVTIDEDSNLARRTLPAGTFETGFRVTNLGPATVYLGATSASGLTNPNSALAHGYPLLKYGTIFIEASNSNGVQCVIDGTGTADIRICGS